MWVISKSSFVEGFVIWFLKCIWLEKERVRKRQKFATQLDVKIDPGTRNVCVNAYDYPITSLKMFPQTVTNPFWIWFKQMVWVTGWPPQTVVSISDLFNIFLSITLYIPATPIILTCFYSLVPISFSVSNQIDS